MSEEAPAEVPVPPAEVRHPLWESGPISHFRPLLGDGGSYAGDWDAIDIEGQWCSPAEWGQRARDDGTEFTLALLRYRVNRLSRRPSPVSGGCLSDIGPPAASSE